MKAKHERCVRRFFRTSHAIKEHSPKIEAAETREWKNIRKESERNSLESFECETRDETTRKNEPNEPNNNLSLNISLYKELFMF